uniref:Uncharacterized protein n=1 Tax=Palpitomonas bilix TaxID=652834 RepID=A0A7S3DAR0_9EUKA
MPFSISRQYISASTEHFRYSLWLFTLVSFPFLPHSTPYVPPLTEESNKEREGGQTASLPAHCPSSFSSSSCTSMSAKARAPSVHHDVGDWSAAMSSSDKYRSPNERFIRKRID